LFNLQERTSDITVTWDQLGIHGSQRVRDVWRQRDIGQVDGHFSASVDRHGVLLLRLWPMNT
jgi:alpha-galactosidase